MKRIALTLAAFSWFTSFTFGDSWFFAPKKVTKNSKFGDSKIVLEIDGTKDQQFPPHTLSIYRHGELVAKYPNVGFDQIFASPDNRFFVGLSNSGIPGTAFVVFDANGNLLREEKHRFLPAAIYTRRSLTIDRTWFDSDNPEVEFDVHEGHLRGIDVRGSGKRKFGLLEWDLGVGSGDPFAGEDNPFAPFAP